MDAHQDQNMTKRIEDMNSIENPQRNGEGYNIPGSNNRIKRAPGELDKTPEELIELGKGVYVVKEKSPQPQISEPKASQEDTKRGNTQIGSATLSAFTRDEIPAHQIGAKNVDLVEKQAEEFYRGKGEPRRLPTKVEKAAAVAALAFATSVAAVKAKTQLDEWQNQDKQAQIQNTGDSNAAPENNTHSNSDKDQKPQGDPLEPNKNPLTTIPQDAINNDIKQEEAVITHQKAIIEKYETDKDLEVAIKRSIISDAKGKISDAKAKINDSISQLRAIFSKGEKQDKPDSLVHNGGEGMVKAETGTSVEAEAKLFLTGVLAVDLNSDKIEPTSYNIQDSKLDNIRDGIQSAVDRTQFLIDHTKDKDPRLGKITQITAYVAGKVVKEQDKSISTPVAKTSEELRMWITAEGFGFFDDGKGSWKSDNVDMLTVAGLYKDGVVDPIVDRLQTYLNKNGDGVILIDPVTKKIYAEAKRGDEASVLKWEKVAEAPEAVNPEIVKTTPEKLSQDFLQKEGMLDGMRFRPIGAKSDWIVETDIPGLTFNTINLDDMKMRMDKLKVSDAFDSSKTQVFKFLKQGDNKWIDGSTLRVTGPGGNGIYRQDVITDTNPERTVFNIYLNPAQFDEVKNSRKETVKIFRINSIIISEFYVALGVKYGGLASLAGVTNVNAVVMDKTILTPEEVKSGTWALNNPSISASYKFK